MYEKYMLLLEEEAKIRNLKKRSILCYKNYVSYFLNHVGKEPLELSCQDVRDFLLVKRRKDVMMGRAGRKGAEYEVYCF